MIIGPVQLSKSQQASVQQMPANIQKMPANIQSGTSTAPADSFAVIQDQSFAATLAKITSEQMAIDTISGSGSNASSNQGIDIGGPNGSATNGSQAELNALTLLLSVQGTQSGGGALSIEGPSTSTAVTGEKVVGRASQLIGTPYLWGGTTPNGFDCSGFTQYVYRQLGISIPRTSEQQATAGTAVQNLASAQPGDLVFFAGSDGTIASPGHVGIYLGNGEMIDAPFTGATVQVQPVSSAGQVVAVRRVVPGASFLGSTTIGNVNVPTQYAATIDQAAAVNGIPSSLLAALISQESGFNPAVVSSAGAQGIAQFMPSTAAGMGIDAADPVQAINGAAKLIASYTHDFGSYANALAAYNAGPAAVVNNSGIPPFPETKAYVSNILSRAGLSGVNGAVA